MISYFLFLFFPLCMIFGAISDVMTMTIPNRLCILILFGFLFASIITGMPLSQIAVFVGFGFSVFLIGFVLFAAGLIGGGDAKFLAAIAFWIGPANAFAFLIVATSLGALLAIALLYTRSKIVPVTGYAFADRLLSSEQGVPYGVALSLAGLHVYLDSPFLHFALSSV